MLWKLRRETSIRFSINECINSVNVLWDMRWEKKATEGSQGLTGATIWIIMPFTEIVKNKLKKVLKVGLSIKI